jgi:hypothetical protein
VIGYHQSTTENSEPLFPANGSFLHVGHVNITDSLFAVFRFCIKRMGFGHCFNENLGPIRSVILSTSGDGPYSFPAWIGNVSGDLIASDGGKTFSIDSNYSFVDVLSFRPSLSGYFTCSATFVDVQSYPPRPIYHITSTKGGSATPITVVVVACFALLGIIGTVIFVQFRRRSAFLIGSEVIGSSRAQVRAEPELPCRGELNELEEPMGDENEGVVGEAENPLTAIAKSINQ